MFGELGKGYFEHNGILLPNTWVKDGASLALRRLFRGENVFATVLYLGLTNASYTFDVAPLTTLAAGEPVGNGYARQAINTNTSDWTVQEVGGVMQAVSKTCVFTCSGAPWTVAWQRAFLCDQASGTAGLVYAVSGPAPAPRTVNVGAGPPINYQFWMRG
jgi:hypothetical protein